MTRPLRAPTAARCRARSSLPLALLAVLAGPAFADEVDKDRAKTLDSIQVTGQQGNSASTATRLPLTLRETPQSVSVINRQQLDDFAMTGIDEVLDHTTGITVGKLDSQRTAFSARGFAISNFQIDGVPQGINAPLSDTIFYDRIEVLRGANGLLGGTGDPSATINMIRKRPLREFSATGAVQLGRWDQRRVEADVSIPLTADGSVRSRVVGAWEDQDSYIKRYEQETRMAMAVFEADLGPDTILGVSLDTQRTDPTGATWGAIPYWNADGSLAGLPRDFSLSTQWSTWRDRQNTWTARLEHTFGNGWYARLSLARVKSTNDTLVGYAGAGYPDPATGAGMSLWTGGWGSAPAINRNLDLYLTGPFHLFGREHTLIAGWNGWFEKSISPGGTLDIPYDPALPDYRDWDGDLPRPAFTPDGSRSEARTQLGGGYLAVRLELADPLHAIAGARISNYRNWTRSYDTGGRYAGTSDRFEVRREVTPYFGLTWDLTQVWSAYASYADLFNPQSFRDRDNQYLDPVTGSNLEAGIKGAWHDGRLNASAALFRTTQQNIAELDPGVPADFVLPGGDRAYVANGDGVVARGVELEASGWLTRGWNVLAGYTFLRAKEQDGSRAVPNQPRHMLRLSTSYDFDERLPGLRIGAAVRAQSDIYGIPWYGRPPAHTDYAHIPQGGYALLDLMARYAFNDSLSLQLNLDNALDRKYYRNVGFYDSVYWGEPRNWSLTLRWKL